MAARGARAAGWQSLADWDLSPTDMKTFMARCSRASVHQNKNLDFFAPAASFFFQNAFAYG
jgi:hypothetical protein